MHRFIGRILVMVMLVIGIITVQSTFAEEVSGDIDAVSIKPNTITVADTVINGIKFNYLLNRYNISLEEGVLVDVVYYEFECSDGSIKNMATDITVDDVTVHLR